MISKSHKFIVVMPMKTAATSFSHALLPYCDVDNVIPQREDCFDFTDKFNKWSKHTPIETIIRKWSLVYPEENLAEYKCFGLVRNPWARAISCYLWFVQKNGNEGIDPEHFLWFLGEINMMSCTAAMSFGGQRVVNGVISFDNLEEGFARLKHEVGLPKNLELPHINTTRHKPYHEHYTPEMREAVATRYQDDIAEFGFQFGAAN